jgi:hypothetical protein
MDSLVPVVFNMWRFRTKLKEVSCHMLKTSIWSVELALKMGLTSLSFYLKSGNA